MGAALSPPSAAFPTRSTRSGPESALTSEKGKREGGEERLGKNRGVAQGHTQWRDDCLTTVSRKKNRPRCAVFADFHGVNALTLAGSQPPALHPERVAEPAPAPGLTFGAQRVK